MLTKILPGDVKPVSARAVSRVHPLPDLGSGKPAGAPGKTDLGTAGTAAPVESTADPRPYLNPNNGERTAFPHAVSEYRPRSRRQIARDDARHAAAQETYDGGDAA
ncbi:MULTISPECIES: hypothetical protein [unclassified Microbacterium]|uniref:hypothetical protein n=1 Tax=unclassified Microbacterium TaxID=2609290 RepID=UPI0016055BD4|nr:MULTISPECIES: hypothetical protein [unclassified Microbacterium]QNA93224.1 hypothetical protein G4G29_14555 [Microbacterium sp. Se63.02b]QYM63432.1 hypothetical protein K1X59_14605 [Microbacterium sp. Se5.02b]